MSTSLNDLPDEFRPALLAWSAFLQWMNGTPRQWADEIDALDKRLAYELASKHYPRLPDVPSEVQDDDEDW